LIPGKRESVIITGEDNKLEKSCEKLK